MIPRGARPGDVLGVPLGLYVHKGILLPDGQVLSASKRHRKVVVKEIEEFAEGRPLRNYGYPGRLPPDQVIARGLALQGRPYGLFRNNCEHLVAHAHGLRRGSPQLNAWLAVALVGVTLAAALRGRAA